MKVVKQNLRNPMSSIRFAVDPDVFAAFPGLQLAVAVAKDIDNTGEYSEIRSAWQSTWAEAQEAQRYGDIQSHPRVRPWRDQWKQIGISSKKFPTSIEALLRRTVKGGEP
ncbi:MAG: hypothetical protein HY731_05735, partial [Candidatus Tectomicrobia bacterium]|nr:hypothetical protein [Candidatus Tectomicrobia bacterium]